MRRRRRLWIVLLAVLCFLAAADTIYWYVAERNLDAGFSAWLLERRADGWTATNQPPVREGWPLAATLTVPQVHLKGGDLDIPGGLTWSTDRLTLRVRLWRPGMLEVVAQGEQKLRLAGGPEIPYTADRLHIAIPLQAGAPPQSADLTALHLRADVPTGGDATSALTVGVLRLNMAFQQGTKSAEPALAFLLHAEQVRLPTALTWPLGPQIERLTAEGNLAGPVPNARTIAERVGAWRDGDGTLELTRFALIWEPLDLSASARLSLDTQLQPMGTGSVRAVGYAETLDALAAHGAISRSSALAAKAVLSLLAHNPEDGGPPDVEVPLTLQYRTLSMRQVPLVRLPELDWP